MKVNYFGSTSGTETGPTQLDGPKIVGDLVAALENFNALLEDVKALEAKAARYKKERDEARKRLGRIVDLVEF